jgi:hypothetical protein
MKPDTHLGENARQIEVGIGLRTTPYGPLRWYACALIPKPKAMSPGVVRKVCLPKKSSAV